MKKIGFRVDGNAKIGMGHVMRTLALASAFPSDIELIFIVKEEAAVLKKLREFQPELKIITLPAAISIGEELDRLGPIIRKEGIEVLVTDSYSFDQNYLQELKKMVGKLVSIHDFAPFPFPSDMVINGNIYARELEYKSLDTRARFLLGTEYILLREEFTGIGKRRLDKKVKRILVTVGGGDPLNLTPRILQALSNLSNLADNPFISRDELKLHVIIGPAFKNLEEIITVAKDLQMTTAFHFNIRRISDLMVIADLAISAGGSTLYELAACGTPAIAILQAENQVQGAEALAEKGTVVNLGWGDKLTREDITASIIELSYNYELRKRMSKTGQDLVDGKGTLQCVRRYWSQYL